MHPAAELLGAEKNCRSATKGKNERVSQSEERARRCELHKRG